MSDGAFPSGDDWAKDEGPSITRPMLFVGGTAALWGLILAWMSAGGLILIVSPESATGSAPAATDPELALIQSCGWLRAYGIADVIARLVLSVMLVATGYGLLTAARWSRPVGYVYAAGSLAIGILGAVVFIGWLLPVRLDAATEAAAAAEERARAGVRIGSMVCSGLLAPLGIALFLRSAHLRAQLGEASAKP